MVRKQERGRAFSCPTPQGSAYSQLLVVAMVAVERGDSGLQQLQHEARFQRCPLWSMLDLGAMIAFAGTQKLVRGLKPGRFPIINSI